eukprot:TRINITY_DN38305_c0_g1_i3.p2 TRINITY_DN38305_c0_g1~~TRINITY_DN38305_c0_g1_i3.p2  ORF type:complete len:213 (-),score=43.83 TRINITY_DN38305_c0_g1_i3:502-1140(-)
MSAMARTSSLYLALRSADDKPSLRAPSRLDYTPSSIQKPTHRPKPKPTVAIVGVRTKATRKRQEPPRRSSRNLRRSARLDRAISLSNISPPRGDKTPKAQFAVPLKPPSTNRTKHRAEPVETCTSPLYAPGELVEVMVLRNQQMSNEWKQAVVTKVSYDGKYSLDRHGEAVQAALPTGIEAHHLRPVTREVRNMYRGQPSPLTLFGFPSGQR